VAEDVFDWSRVVEPLLDAYERLVRRVHVDVSQALHRLTRRVSA
jgi:hypothetical protein